MTRRETETEGGRGGREGGRGTDGYIYKYIERERVGDRVTKRRRERDQERWR